MSRDGRYWHRHWALEDDQWDLKPPAAVTNRVEMLLDFDTIAAPQKTGTAAQGGGFDESLFSKEALNDPIVNWQELGLPLPR